MTQATSIRQQLLELGIDELMPDPSQPRRSFPPDHIARLAASIAARGMLTPIRVASDEARQSWRIVCGESRWRAARLAGLLTVPCLPVVGDFGEADSLADQLTENVLRFNLRPLEEARALAKLKALKGMNSQTLAAEMGLSPSNITKAEALLSLPEAIQAMVDDGRVAEDCGYQISRLPDEAAMFELAHAVASGQMSRDSLAEAVRDRVGRRKHPKPSKLACTLDGVAVSFTSGKQPLTLDLLLKAIEHLRREARKMAEGGGGDIEALARSLRVSG